MDRLEDLANRIMDADATWWPFLYLRPSREAPMTTALVAKMALHFGPVIGVFIAGIALARPHEARATEVAGVSMLAATFGFFVLYRLTFALFWNRRCARMTRR